MEASYTLFDHTADVGIRVIGRSLEDLVGPAAQGLYEVIGRLLPGEEPRDESWTFCGEEPAVLLRDYLAELLLLFENEMRVVIEPLDITFTQDGLEVRAKSVSINQRHSEFQREVKAITYHELKIVEIDGGHEATIVVDI